jgi:PRC-barrel domain
VTEPKPNVPAQAGEPKVTVAEQKPEVSVVKQREAALAKPAAVVPAPAALPPPPPPPLAVNAGHYIGNPVFGLDHNQIGTISNVLIGPNGHVKGILVKYGGFLGIPPRVVAVKWDELSLMPNHQITVHMTKAEFNTAPRWIAKSPPPAFAEAHLLRH